MCVWDKDFYKLWAAKLFNIPYEEVTNVQRLEAKADYNKRMEALSKMYNN